MKETRAHFEVFQEGGDLPVMFGIRVPGGVCARRISSDYNEVDRLARMCNRNELSPVHLDDVVNDFRRR